jgi:hypothetical protein
VNVFGVLGVGGPFSGGVCNVYKITLTTTTTTKRRKLTKSVKLRKLSNANSDIFFGVFGVAGLYISDRFGDSTSTLGIHGDFGVVGNTNWAELI